MILNIAALPWLLLVGSLLFLARRRPRLDDYAPDGGGAAAAGAAATGAAGTGVAAATGAAAGAAAAVEESGALPRVSVIVPTRNDADRVGLCLATLLASDYSDFEVIVVDHESRDGTREVVEALVERSPDHLRLVRAGEAPAGRPWRAWSCGVGVGHATGDLLLFTEPGTVQARDLMGRAVSALRAEAADLLTVQPRLTMRGFWERLVMPHVWLLLRARFPSARLVNRSRSPRNAVAHHQYLLFRREAYEAIGGHDVVMHGSVEDLVVPQAVVTAGLRSFLVHGDRFLEARMSMTLADITDDWTATLPPAVRTTFAPWAAFLVPWLVVATPLVLWTLPPLLLVAGVVTGGWGELAVWGFQTVILSLVFWLVIYAVHRIRPAYAMAYPVGALATSVIFARSMLRAGRDPDVAATGR